MRFLLLLLGLAGACIAFLEYRWGEEIVLPTLLLQMGLWLGGLGLGMALLFWKLQPKNLLPSVCLSLVFPLLVLVYKADTDAAAAVESGKLKSDLIWHEDLYLHAMVLLPDLRDAVMIVPDRPVRMTEIQGFQLEKAVTRRRVFHVNTNHLGLRGKREVEKPKRHFRILTLGGSVTFGHGVEEPDTWAALLEKDLGVEVFNGGAPGRPPDANARWALKYAAPVEPDLILFSEVPLFNNADPLGTYASAVKQVAAAFPKARMAVALSPTNLFMDWYEHPNAPYKRIGEAIAPIPFLEVTDTYRDRAPRRGVHIEHANGKQLLRDRLTGWVLEEAPETPDRQPAMSILQSFEDHKSYRMPFFLDHAHLDEEGHAIFARLLAAWLREQGLVPAEPSPG